MKTPRPWKTGNYWGMKAYKGIHQFKDYANGRRHGVFEVFWSEDIKGKEGWYWFSDSYNNGNPIGPFDTSYKAYHDAVDMEVELEV